MTNTGKFSGKEVVQVYIAKPQGKLGKPAKELVAFEKTLDELSERYDLYIVSNCQRGYIESFFAYHGPVSYTHLILL